MIPHPYFAASKAGVSVAVNSATSLRVFALVPGVIFEQETD
jgi:hypothetical protein